MDKRRIKARVERARAQERALNAEQASPIYASPPTVRGIPAVSATSVRVSARWTPSQAPGGGTRYRKQDNVSNHATPQDEAAARHGIDVTPAEHRANVRRIVQDGTSDHDYNQH